MDKEIVLSDELWNYYVTVKEICEQVYEAYLLAKKADDLVKNENTYQGIAYEEIALFMDSVREHIQKLVTLYSAAETYLVNTFIEKCELEELLEWKNSHLGL